MLFYDKMLHSYFTSCHKKVRGISVAHDVKVCVIPAYRRIYKGFSAVWLAVFPMAWSRVKKRIVWLSKIPLFNNKRQREFGYFPMKQLISFLWISGPHPLTRPWYHDVLIDFLLVCSFSGSAIHRNPRQSHKSNRKFSSFSFLSGIGFSASDSCVVKRPCAVTARSKHCYQWHTEYLQL